MLLFILLLIGRRSKAKTNGDDINGVANLKMELKIGSRVRFNSAAAGEEMNYEGWRAYSEEGSYKEEINRDDGGPKIFLRPA